MSGESRKRVKYVGPSPRVEVALLDGSNCYCDHGKSIAVPTAVAKNLLEQDIWEDGTGVKATDEPEAPEPDTKAAKK